MSAIDPTYPIMEFAVCLINSSDLSVHERKKEGDIIGQRQIGVVNGVGTKETKGTLWIRLQGLEQNEMWSLVEVNADPQPDGTTYDKRRYCIPLARLQLLYPALDIDRCRDADDMYQPFLTLDEDDYTFLTEENDFEVSGLVYDKYTGEYL